MTPSTPRHRRTRAFLFVALFVVLIPVVVAFALGYRFDDQWRLVDTGGIALRNVPADAEVYVDYRLVSPTRTFSNNIFFTENLVPKTYLVVVAEKGHWSWAKQVLVSARKVSDVSVLLVPQQSAARPISEFVPKSRGGFFSLFSGDEDESIATTTGTPSATLATTTFTSNPEYAIVKALFDGQDDSPREDRSKDIPGTKELPLVKNRAAVWHEKNALYASWLGDEQAIPFFLNGTSTQQFFTWPASRPVLRLDFFPGRRDVVLVLASDGLYALEIDKRPEQNSQPVYLGRNLDFRVSTDEKLYIHQGGQYFEVAME